MRWQLKSEHLESKTFWEAFDSETFTDFVVTENHHSAQFNQVITEHEFKRPKMKKAFVIDARRPSQRT